MFHDEVSTPNFQFPTPTPENWELGVGSWKFSC
jgi:hypothetical protein